MTKFKTTLTGVVVPVLVLLASLNLGSANSAIKENENRFGETGTLQKMIVENGSVTMQLDLNGLNGSGSLVARPVMLLFAAAPNSFFPILVFNDLLRRIEPGSMALAFRGSSSGGVNFLAQSYGDQDTAGYNLPVPLRTSLKRLTLEKLPP